MATHSSILAQEMPPQRSWQGTVHGVTKSQTWIVDYITIEDKFLKKKKIVVFYRDWCPWSVAKSFNPMDCSSPGSSAHGIFQARILEWVVISFSRGSPWPTDWTQVSCVSCRAGRYFYHWATWEAHRSVLLLLFMFRYLIHLVVVLQ